MVSRLSFTIGLHLCVLCVAFAATKTQSISTYTSHNNTDSSRIWVNLKLSRLGNSPQHLSYAEKALALSLKSGFKYGEAKSLEHLGIFYLNANEPAKAMEFFYNALDVFYNIGAQQESDISLVYIGNIFYRFKKNDLTRAYAAKAKNLLFQCPDPEKRVHIINHLCDLFLKIEDYNTALEIAGHFENDFQKSNDYGEVAFHYLLIAKNVMKQDKPGIAIRYNNKALEVCEKNGATNLSIYIYSLNNKANIYLEANEITKSISLYENAIEHSKKINSQIWLAINYRDLSMAFNKAKDITKAERYANIYLKTSLENQFLEDIKRAYLLLSEYELAKRNYFSAYSHLLKYSKLSESISKDENSLFIKNVLYKRDLDITSRQNISLKKENEKKDTIIRDKQLLQLGLITVSLLVFVFAICVIFFIIQYRINNQLLKSRNDEIFEKNKQLENQNQLLERLNQEKDGLIGIVSHDLKAPLNRVESLINFVKSEGDFNASQELYLQLINKELESSKDLIKRILDSEIKENSETSENQVEEFNITKFMNDIISNYNITAANKHITIHPCYKPGNIKISTNKNHLGRIIDNLLSNAVKFSDSYKNIFVDIKDLHETISIDVRDEGPGLTEEDKKNLFKKYQKLSATPTGGEVSTGLGLHIVRKLSFEIGGDILVKSNPGEGATFSIVLKKQAPDNA